jgi:hypothetical protein
MNPVFLRWGSADIACLFGWLVLIAHRKLLFVFSFPNEYTYM